MADPVAPRVPAPGPGRSRRRGRCARIRPCPGAPRASPAAPGARVHRGRAAMPAIAMSDWMQMRI